MNTKRVLFKWLAISFVIAILLQFSHVMPSVSAQSGQTATPTATSTATSDRISCYGGTTGVQCVEDTNSYIRMEINQVSGGGNGDVHLRLL